MVARRRELVAEPAAQPGLLLDLAQRGLLPALAGVELALGQRPVVVARAVHDRDLAPAGAAAHDDAARRLDLRRFGIDRHRLRSSQRATKLDAGVTFVAACGMTALPTRLRDRRRLVRHRRRQGARTSAASTSTASRSPTASAATGSSRTRNGMSSAYRSLHINTSRERMEYSDFPMPKSYPDFPHHTHIARVLRRLRRPLRLPRPDHVRDRRRARRARRRRRLGGHARRRRRRAATTRCWSPTATTGTRAGPSRRSPAPTSSRACRCTRTTTRARTRTSSATSASSCSGWATRRWTSRSRRASSPSARLPRRAPRRVGHPEVPVRPAARPDRRRAADPVRGAPDARPGRCCKVAVGDMERYGLPEARPPAAARRTRRSPTTSSRASPTATITPKPNIARLTERTVVASPTAREVEADVVVYCTGYKVTFPFFDAGFISAPDNDLPLFRRVFHPDIAERVLHRAAAAARGDHAARRGAVGVGLRLPRRPLRAAAPADDARRHRATSARAMFKRYVASKRHTMQVDFDDYLAALGKERKARRGAGAARRAPRCRCRRAPADAAAGVTALARRRAPRARPRPPTARRSSPRRATSSPSSATARPACATSCAAPSSPRARSTTTSPTRRRSSARSSRRSAREARRRVRARAPRGRDAARRSSRRLPRVLRVHRRGPGDVRVPAPQRRHDPRRCSATRCCRRAPTSWPRTCARRSRAGALPALDVDYCAHAMVAVGLELGARLAERDPPDVERATRFATDLFLGAR